MPKTLLTRLANDDHTVSVGLNINFGDKLLIAIQRNVNNFECTKLQPGGVTANVRVYLHHHHHHHVYIIKVNI